ncbi:SCO6880 family protein [Yinghuangia sp. YIM S09857]|uniref:SCO6880 family protein n=1 Tax=Yinghuangia sp. YIM S09857 TaxID=3436929 RepID=UPI003F538D7E
MAENRVRTYGNWRKPSSPGIGKLGLGGSIFVMVGLGIVTLTMMVSTIAAIVMAVVLMIAIAPLIMRDPHGRNGLQWLGSRIAWFRGMTLGQHIYRSGPVGRLPVSTSRLPGLLAGMTVLNSVDGHGQPFALVSHPTANHHTVVLNCSADGASLVDQHQMDVWVAYWGRWLANLAYEPRLVSAAVTIETAPDSGERLRREVLGNVDMSAPPLALEVLKQVMFDYPVGSAEITSRIALTYSSAGESRAHRTPEELAAEIGIRLPALAGSLAMTGAGPADPLTVDDLAHLVRVAYDPGVGVLSEQARGEGSPPLRWEEAGPMATQEAWDHYRHDGAHSITWAMTEAPRGEVFSTVLSRLVAPHPDIVRKRVTLLYRPHTPAESAKLVERDRKDAMFRAQQSRVAQARDSVDLRSADQSAREEATGAGLVRFGLLVTATVMKAEDMRLAAAAIDNLAATSRIRLRRAYGAQSSSFAAALPLGLVLGDHMRVPQSVRNSV